MTHSDETPVWLRRFAKFVAAATLFLIFAGAMVTSTGSGLAVPDWPLSYGMVFPPMVGGIFYEHGHRMIAATVGFLTVIQAIWLQLHEPKRFIRLLGWTSVGAVIAQGLLGGLTVVLLLPPAISIGHAALAEIFFSLNVSIAFFTSAFFTSLASGNASSPASSSGAAAASAAEGWAASQGARAGARGQAPLHLGATRHSTAIVGLVYLQILLGALMRHLGAGLAIPDFPLSFGRIVPPIHSLSVAANFAHRSGALIVTLAILFLGVSISRLSAADPVRRLYQVLLSVLGAQVMLGAYTVWSAKHPIVTSLHVMTGALTLAISLLLCLTVRARRTVTVPERTSEPVVIHQEVTA
jgi:cytochrome c oxidase assembly protein subunit 15